MSYLPVYRDVVRFDTEAEAWAYMQTAVRQLKSYRIADYGIDPGADQPVWVAIDHLSMWESYSPEQLQRWKASGRTDL